MCNGAADGYPGLRSWIAYPPSATCCLACGERMDEVKQRQDGYYVCPACHCEMQEHQLGNPNADAIMSAIYGSLIP